MAGGRDVGGRTDGLVPLPPGRVTPWLPPLPGALTEGGRTAGWLPPAGALPAPGRVAPRLVTGGTGLVPRPAVPPSP